MQLTQAHKELVESKLSERSAAEMTVGELAEAVRLIGAVRADEPLDAINLATASKLLQGSWPSKFDAEREEIVSAAELANP